MPVIEASTFRITDLSRGAEAMEKLVYVRTVWERLGGRDRLLSHY